MRKKDRTRLIAIIVAIMIVIMIIFSYCFVIEHAHHDCKGKDCPICMELEMALQIISSLKVITFLPFLIAILCVFTQISGLISQSESIKDTLITLKVELLN